MAVVPDRWGIVGGGRCGLQLARALVAAGQCVVGVIYRSAHGRSRLRRWLPEVPAIGAGAALPAASVLLVAVPDDALRALGERLARHELGGIGVVLHTSGLHAGTILSPLQEHRIAVGSFHPLVAFSRAGGPPVSLRGALATVEGDEAAVRAGRRLARSLGMTARRIGAADKPGYHAAAVIAANLTHVLVVEALSLLESAGFARREAARALRPLVGDSIAAALAAGGLERLTGPLARGDAATVTAHLSVLDEPLAGAYRAVAALAVTRLQAARPALTAEKSALDSVLRALTVLPRCGSVLADERN